MKSGTIGFGIPKTAFLLYVLGVLLPGIGKAQCNQVSNGIWECLSGTTGAQLRARLESAQFGETIRLARGEYLISGAVTLGGANPANANWVTLEGRGMQSTVISFTTSTDGLKIQASNVTVRNLTIRRNASIYTDPGIGIATSGSAQGLCLSNLGLYRFKDAVSLGGPTTSSSIHDCFFSGNGNGIVVLGSAGDNMVFSRNTMVGNAKHGMYFGPTNTAYTVHISDNVIEANGKSGIMLYNGRTVTINNNYFDGNEWALPPDNESYTQDAHILVQETGTEIRNLTIRDNYFGLQHYGGSDYFFGFYGSNVKYSHRNTPGSDGQSLRPWRFANSSGTLVSGTGGAFGHSGNIYHDYLGNSADGYYCVGAVNCLQ